MPRLTGVLWWVDRWRKSSAFSDMTAEQQGLYRNLLDEVWLREDHIIPDVPRILAKISGDPEAWGRSGDIVLKWMKKVEGGWTHETALETIRSAELRAERQARYRNRQYNAQHNEPHNEQRNNDHNNQRSPSPSPITEKKISNSKDLANSEVVASTTSTLVPKTAPPPVNARSKRPLFTGQRFTVFEWQLDDLSRLLGKHANDFDIHSWFFDLDARCLQSGEVIPQRDGGQWLQAQTLAEAQRRGLPIASANPPEQRFGKQTRRLIAAVANMRDTL